MTALPQFKPRALHPDHLKEFRSCIPKGPIGDPYSPAVPSKWADCTGLAAQLPAEKMNRQRLLKLAGNNAVETAVVCWSILAWGGMHGAHRDTLSKQCDREWLELSTKVRAGCYSRATAYEKFSELKRTGNLNFSIKRFLRRCGKSLK